MRVIVRSGQRVAADGVIERGAAHMDQSAVTGESVPVYRQVGENVWAGSLALDSAITIRVTRAGQDSTVGQIIKIVQEAEQYQAPAMRIADQWAKYYTPTILAVAALTPLSRFPSERILAKSEPRVRCSRFRNRYVPAAATWLARFAFVKSDRCQPFPSSRRRFAMTPRPAFDLERARNPYCRFRRRFDG